MNQREAWERQREVDRLVLIGRRQVEAEKILRTAYGRSCQIVVGEGAVIQVATERRITLWLDEKGRVVAAVHG